MKKTNRFWVVLPAVCMLFATSMQANELPTTVSATPVKVARVGSTQLNLAISKGDLAKVQQLAELGVDLNQRDERGTTPLMYAIMYKQTEIVNYLLKKGADFRAKDNNGFSVSDFAEKSKSEEIIKLVNEARKRG